MSTPSQRSIPTYLPVPFFNDDLSPALKKQLFLTPDSALKQGLHILGGPGAGKSRLIGRVVAWQAFVRGLPSVIFDPTGSVTDNLFDKLSRLPADIGQPLAKRLIYIDAGAKDYVVPSPFYRRHSAQESYTDIANRFIEVLVEEDPELERAPILGKNSLVECASYAGQIASFLGLQTEFVHDLVKHPNRYADLLTYVVNQAPALEKAANYFRELANPKHMAMHERKTLAFLNKLHPFLSDTPVRATFNATTPGIDWAEVVRKRQLVVYDYRDEWNPDRRRFKLLWDLKNVTTFAKYRGVAGRGAELLLIIDELTQLLGYKKVAGESVLAQEIEELMTVLGRNFGVNVVIAHQNLRQVDERIQTALMQMGNQCLFHLDHPDDTFLLARYFLKYEPYKVKRREQHWVMMKESTAAWLDPDGENINGQPYVQGKPWLFGRDIPFPLGESITYFAPEEQFLEVSDLLRTLPRFRFYLRPATAEGQIDNQLYPLTLENLDPGEWPDEELGVVREWLRQQSGRPVDAVLAEMAAHTSQVLKAAKQARVTTAQEKEKALAANATIGETAHDTTRHPVPRTTTPAGVPTTGATTDQTPPTDEESVTFR